MDLPLYAPLPPKRARLGPVEASWEEIDPGVALIRTQGGTSTDRALVFHLLRSELAENSIEHAQFHIGASERTSMAFPGDLWHVSPASNRAAIESQGLVGHHPSTPMYNPTARGRGIRGNYAVDDLRDAEAYAHMLSRATAKPHDIWQISNSGALPVQQDPETYLFGQGDEISREEAPNPHDFERGKEWGDAEDDPDHNPSYYWSRPEPQDWDSEFDGKWHDQDESLESNIGVRPIAWHIPVRVPSHQLTHIKTIRPEDADWQEHWMGDYLPEASVDHLVPEPFHRVRWDSPEEYQEAANAFLRHKNGSRRTAKWADIEAKAKRLIQSGQVQLLRNSRNAVVAHVIGDHGEYNSEFSRDDPDSWTMTQWTCECPWQQYAYQRTRQWKKYEGRPCAHVLATFWASRSHPLDEELAPGDTLPRGHKGFPGADPGGQGTQQQMFTPDDGSQFTQPFQPPEQMITPPPPPPDPQGQLFDPAAPPDNAIIPEQPMLPGMALPLPVPGTTPGGMASQPNAVSVPGAAVPTPFNPIQQGGTYSKIAQARFENGMTVQILTAQYGLAEGKSEAHGAGQYREVPAGSKGEVLGQDETTGWVEVIIPLGTSGPMEPHHVRMFLAPKDLKIVGYPPGSPFIQRRGPHS